MEIKRFETGERMSQMVVAGGFAFIAGQVADDTSLDVAGQTRQILDKLDRLLELAGGDKRLIVSASIWLADHRSFAEMNSVWDAWVPKGQAPARACVESKLAFPPYTVEIAAIAAIGATAPGATAPGASA
ncbi:RidA family protein [Paraburkholderia sp. Ac-20347]|uniref:RidA family protein n=1 Tax=Paraburkholderia sp. Ac-20347 TaxID=2703892 RepID=UPI00198116F4|nr:RidA family protein [Paraburkholderia sp. Ac-20347]MBN3813390.1 RidA family protein [Paraburkholderia sp. Ac-20347]